MRRVWLILLAVLGQAVVGWAAQTGVRISRELVYTTAAGVPLRMNLYLPPGDVKAAPVVLYIHGGDWMYGNRRNAAGAFLTQYGLAVASIDYRLAPRHRFPAQAKDCRDALVFLYKNAARCRLDPERIGVMGESAGGHLAALLATAADAPEFVGSYRETPAPRIAAMCSVSGPMDITYLGTLGDMLEDVIGRHGIQQLLGGRVSERLALSNLASPIRHVSKGDPPTLLVYGEKDFVVPPILAKKMHEALDGAGVENEVYGVRDMGHDMAGMYENCQVVVAGFFQRHLMGYPTTRPVVERRR